jgi:hypothetical protein
MSEDEKAYYAEQKHQAQMKERHREGYALGYRGDALRYYTATGHPPANYGKSGEPKLSQYQQERLDALNARAAELKTTADKLPLEEIWKVDQSLHRRGSELTGEAKDYRWAVDVLAHPEQHSREDQTTAEAIKKKWERGPKGEMAHQSAEKIAGAIMRGEQDPNLVGLGREGTAADVRAILADNHYNLLRAQNDLFAMRKFMSTANNSQQVRLRQATEFATESLDLLDNPEKPGDDIIGQLRNSIPRSQFPVLNKAALAAARNGVFGEEAAEAARNLEQQVTDLQSEMAVVYMGGNSPTDKGLAQAQKILSGDWSDATLRNAIDLARTNLRLRLNSIRRTGPTGMSPEGQQRYPLPPAPPPPTPPRPRGGGTVKMRAPNGQIWNAPADQVEHFRQQGATVVQE